MLTSPKIFAATIGAAAVGSILAATPAVAGTPSLGTTNRSSAAAGQTTHWAAAAMPRQTAREYAQGLMVGWRGGDSELVDELATPSVANQLFAFANPGGGDWARTGSEGTAGTIYVTFESRAHHEKLAVGVIGIVNLAKTEHAVNSAKFVSEK